MVVLRLPPGAGLMRRPHVVEVIRTPEFECPQVLDDPDQDGADQERLGDAPGLGLLGVRAPSQI